MHVLCDLAELRPINFSGLSATKKHAFSGFEKNARSAVLPTGKQRRGLGGEGANPGDADDEQPSAEPLKDNEMRYGKEGKKIVGYVILGIGVLIFVIGATLCILSAQLAVAEPEPGMALQR